jgi:hypothetical protein
MKKIFFLSFLATTFFIFMAAFLFVAGCAKESLPQPTGNLGGNRDFAEFSFEPSCEDPCDRDDDPYPCDPDNVLEAMSDTSDLENDRINMILYHYGQALRQAVQDTTRLDYILDNLVVNNEPVPVSILLLGQNNTSFGSFINSKLRQSIASNNIYPRGVEAGIDALAADTTWDASSYLKEKMIHIGYSYEAVAYLTQRPYPGSEEKPVTILIAQDVNDCDDVVGWQGNTEVMVGEEETMNASSNVIIFVGPGNPEELEEVAGSGDQERIISPSNYDNYDELPPIDEISERSHGAIIARSLLQIKSGYRHEKSGKSEVVGWIVGFDSGSAPTFLDINNFKTQHKVKKKEVKNSKVFDWSSDPKDFAIVTPITGWTTNFGWIGFYEFDWWVLWNFKKIQAPCATNTDIKVELGMKYSNEWYIQGYWCALGSSTLPYSNSSKNMTNIKSSFTLVRTN